MPKLTPEQLTLARMASPKCHRIGPYSRRLALGVGAGINGSSALGRYIRHLESELVAYIGGHPTITERLLVGRIIRMCTQLDAFDRKLEGGREAWTDIDRRTFGALNNALRLALRELKPATRSDTPDLASYLEQLGREKTAEASPKGPMRSPGSLQRGQARDALKR